MALFNNSQSQRNNSRVNVNTPFLRSYSDTCLLSLTGWNQSLSLRINPATGKDANGVVQYSTDQGQSLITSITAANAVAWAEGIETYILPAIKEKVASERVTITSGGKFNNSTRKALTLWFDGVHCYFECADGMGDDGTVPPGHSIIHEFPEKTYLVGYNKDTGAAIKNVVYSDFLMFYDRIKNVHNLSPMIAHSIKYDNAFKSSGTQGGSGFGSTQSGGFGNGGFATPQPQAPVAAMQSMDSYALPLL